MTHSFRKVHIQYIFLDVVQFTRSDRTVEDMVSIIQALNQIVTDVLDERQLVQDDVILLPTGDGMCIGLLNQHDEDTHLEIAQSLLDQVRYRNVNTRDEGKCFELHIAVHESKDILIHDINERRNIIGSGINKASRLMDQCGPGQIVLSSTVYDGVYKYARFKGLFDKDEFTDKAGELIYFYRSRGVHEIKQIGDTLLSAISLLKYDIGPLLTVQDISELKVGSELYHKVYGVGKLAQAAIPAPGSQGRIVSIDFSSRRHNILLTNRRKNYHKLVPKQSTQAP